MSHPLPTHDYSEQTRHESNKDYSKRRNGKAVGKALERAKGGLNKNQRMTGGWLREAGESFRKKGESPLSHLKRISN